MASLSSLPGQPNSSIGRGTDSSRPTSSLPGWLSCLYLIACISFPGVVFGGTEAVRSSDTVRIAVDSRWPGNAHGGYVPLRIKLTNLGPEQDFQLVFKNRNSNSQDRMPEVRRTVHLDQNATRDFSLPIPVVSVGIDGELKVLDGRGEEIEDLKTAHTLPEYGGDAARASMLVIAVEDLDDKSLEPFENAAATECATLRGLAALSGGSRHGSSRVIESDHLVIPPTDLPENWTDYSGIDLIAISWPNLSSKLKTAEREALLKWAACGGVLIIYDTEKPAAELEPLHQMLQLDQAAGKRWMSIELPIIDTHIIQAKTLNAGTIPGNAYSRGTRPPGAMPQRGPGGAELAPAVAEAAAGDVPGQWISNSNSPVFRDWSFGRIYVFPKNPFPGVANDWAWLLASLPQNQSRWSSRMGMSSRNSGTEFLNFLIPGVGSVPVHAFLVLITIFTIVIGPLNYYWLRKTRRVGALVFTVPLIASVACMMLFVYSLVADGFSVRSRLHSVTFLDQQAKSAASLSRLCLYAPFAPSAGLKFSPNVAAFPIWPYLQRFESGTVDWTGNEQHLSSGWFRSQTWTQFLLVEQRDERGRLDFTPPADPESQELSVSNGYAWDLEYLAIEALPGRWYAGEKIPAGGTAQLKRLDQDEVGLQFTKLIAPHAWNLPEGLKDTNSMFMGGMGGRGPYSSGGYYPYGRTNVFAGTTTLSKGQLQTFQSGATMPGASPALYQADWRASVRAVANRHSEAVRPHFWAVSSQNPGIEIGVKNTVERGSFHLLFGVL
ncbi:MAG: hypothetical protein JWM11_4447 [Planctomycetaceae bacterium]|nr:hypothetical protein [Planctomycetaceae bacterium]